MLISLSRTPLLLTFLNEKTFSSPFLYTLFEVSQLKTIWFEAENWPGHFTLEVENPFACTLHCIFTFLCFFYVFYVLSFSFAKSPLVWFVKTFGSNAHAPPKTGGPLCRCKPYLNKPKNT